MKNNQYKRSDREARLSSEISNLVAKAIIALIINLSLIPLAAGSELKTIGSPGMTLDSLALIYNDVNASNFPRIVSLVTVTNEAGLIVGKLDENNFEVREDSVRELPIVVEELPAAEIGINVVLTIDRSESMAGQPITDARNAARIFADLMQSLDKSAIVSFNHTPWTEHPFTGNIDSLKSAISKITASGYTAVFDAIIHSVYLITNDLKNRAIILLTDGADNRSRYTYQESLNALISHEVRAFTIGLGLKRNSPEENVLKDLAGKTGGLYFYSPTSKELEEIYRAISKLLHHRYQISYSTHNTAKDSTLRHVRIEVVVNRNSSSDTANYRAPYEKIPDPPPPPVDPPVVPPVDPPVEPPPPEPVFEVVPNPFTPNEDGFNDRIEFRQGVALPQAWNISIMDRAGRMIKHLSHGERFWDGKDEGGQFMLPGCYLYIVSNGSRAIHRGFIQLIR